MPRYSSQQKAVLDALMRDQVYGHALEIIASEGLPALTLDRLARRIGVSRGNLYNYFADREAIIDFIEARTFEPLIDDVARIADGDTSAAAKLEAIATMILTAVRDNLTLVVALSPEKFRRRDKRSHLRRRERGLGLFRQVFREGIESGEFRELPPDLLSEVFYATITGLVDNMASSGEFWRPEEIVPTLMAIYQRGLESGKGMIR